jgi:hypothetical protein
MIWCVAQPLHYALPELVPTPDHDARKEMHQLVCIAGTGSPPRGQRLHMETVVVLQMDPRFVDGAFGDNGEA